MIVSLLLALQATAAAPTPPAAPEKPKLVCRSDAATGSRIPAKRVCKTQAEWDARSREDRAVMDRMLDDRNRR